MDNPPSEPLIQLKSVSKQYVSKKSSVEALRNIDLSIADGEFVCIIGPSGCGKTTLLWGISGLHAFSSGSALLGGEPIVSGDPRLAMVFQDSNLLPWRTVYKNILLAHELRRTKPDEGYIAHLLDRVALSGFEKRMPAELSGGMRQRVSIVRAMATRPSVLLMDEPFSALDAFTRDDMNLLVQDVWMEAKRTVIFVTHSITEAVMLADRVVVLSPRPGQIETEVTVDFPRPRSIDLQTEPAFMEIVRDLKSLLNKLAGGAQGTHRTSGGGSHGSR